MSAFKTLVSDGGGDGECDDGGLVVVVNGGGKDCGWDGECYSDRDDDGEDDNYDNVEELS